MSAKIYLISPDYLKENSPINENVDEKVLQPLIMATQDMRIHPVIGTGLYNEIKDQIKNSTLTSDNQTLLNDYILPAMVWWCMYDAPFDLTYKFMNKSVVKRNSDNSAPPDIEELHTIANKYRDKAEFYTKRLERFLCAYAATYQLYNNPGSGYDVLVPSHQAYQTGMNLDILYSSNTSLRYNKQALRSYECGCVGHCGCGYNPGILL